jgi:GDPmannose 4,6-dehydratase
MKVSLITGITGQDGSYLTELLLDKDYDVWGLIRRSSNFNTSRIDHLYNNKNLILRYGDLTDSHNINSILFEIKQKYGDNLERLEIYNLGAMSHVKVSFEMPEYTAQVDAVGTLHILEAIRSSGYMDKIRFYQACTSEMYGKVQEVPQNETTNFNPRSPYGVAKLYSYWITKNYREAYNMFAVSGILFNHESPRRGPTFVTRKITLGLNDIITGKSDKLVLGNLDSLRDWGHASDYVRGMWLMLQNDNPKDYVLATNEYHSVREFVEKSFALRGFDIRWRGEDINEIGYDKNTGRELIFISDKYFRPTEVDELLGDASLAKAELGWTPTILFNELVKEMVDSDCSI